MNDYKIVNGTSYCKDTPEKVINWLETSRERKQRIRIFYGDKETGRDWREENDTQGHIGRTTGNVKIPILIKTKHSSGGSAILDNCIVKITIDKKIVYQHKNYHLYEKSIGLEKSDRKKLPYGIIIDDRLYARFETKEKAENYIKFLKGERNKI